MMRHMRLQVDTATLPSLPNHAKYVHQSGPCYDMGSYGWLLSSGHLQYRQYKYFFFLNSSVRGPYLPAYARVGAKPCSRA